MNFAEQYSYNMDGSVRGEFVTKGQGVIPLSYGAKMFGVDLMKKIRCKKSDFRGLIFGVKYVNDDGLACDSDGNPLEDPTTYTLTSEIRPEAWDLHLFLNHDGSSALDDDEWAKLSPEDQQSYRKVDCIEVELAAGVPINEPVYLCKEAAIILIEMFRQDVLIGDPINKRYQHECQHNEVFATQFGYMLNRALIELEREKYEMELAHHFASEIIGALCEIFNDDDDDEDEEKSGNDEEDESTNGDNNVGEEDPDKTDGSDEAKESEQAETKDSND